MREKKKENRSQLSKKIDFIVYKVTNGSKTAIHSALAYLAAFYFSISSFPPFLFSFSLMASFPYYPPWFNLIFPIGIESYGHVPARYTKA